MKNTENNLEKQLYNWCLKLRRNLSKKYLKKEDEYIADNFSKLMKSFKTYIQGNLSTQE